MCLFVCESEQSLQQQFAGSFSLSRTRLYGKVDWLYQVAFLCNSFFVNKNLNQESVGQVLKSNGRCDSWEMSKGAKWSVASSSPGTQFIEYQKKNMQNIDLLKWCLFSQTLMNAKINLVRMAALALILPPEATRVIALKVSKEKDARRVRLSG